MKTLTIVLLLTTTMAFAQPIYTEKESYQVEVTENGHVQVRKATRVYKDGVEIAKTYHRHVLAPDTSEETLNEQVDKVKAIAEAAWTKEIKDAYEKQKLEQLEKIEEPNEL